jgi:hypothetical protein
LKLNLPGGDGRHHLLSLRGARDGRSVTDLICDYKFAAIGEGLSAGCMTSRGSAARLIRVECAGSLISLGLTSDF